MPFSTLHYYYITLLHCIVHCIITLHYYIALLHCIITPPDLLDHKIITVHHCITLLHYKIITLRVVFITLP